MIKNALESAMSYLMIELLIVAAALILFVVSFCGFLQKWRLYVQELEEQNNRSNEKSKDNNAPPSYNHTIEMDLPPKYDDAVKMPECPPLRNDFVLNVQNLQEVQEKRVEIV